jgi:hypothetical protein
MNPRVEYLHRTLKDYIEQPRIWIEIRSSAPSFDPHVSLFKAYALQMKSLDYRIDKSSEGDNSLSPWFNDMVANAMRSFELAKSSEWKQLISLFHALIAIFTRKFVREGRTSTDHSSAWSLVIDELFPISKDSKTTGTESRSSTKWEEVTEILLSHGADSELLRSKGFDCVCKILDARSNARTISMGTVKEFEDEGRDEIDGTTTEENSKGPVNGNQHRRKRQRIH